MKIAPISRPPLQATLQVAGGDRAKALKMLEDPDALMANPDIKKIIAEGAATEDAALEVVEGQYPEATAVSRAGGGKGSGRKGGGGGTGAAPAEKEKEEVVEKEATDEDPREHLNLVFIGHGMHDARHSRLSRTVDRFATVMLPLTAVIHACPVLKAVL